MRWEGRRALSIYCRCHHNSGINKADPLLLLNYYKKVSNTKDMLTTYYADLPGDTLCFTHCHLANDIVGRRGSLTGPRSPKTRTRCTASVAVLALIFPSHHGPLSPLCQSELAWGALCRDSGEAIPRVGRRRRQAPKTSSPLVRENSYCAAPIRIRR